MRTLLVVVAAGVAGVVGLVIGDLGRDDRTPALAPAGTPAPLGVAAPVDAAAVAAAPARSAFPTSSTSPSGPAGGPDGREVAAPASAGGAPDPATPLFAAVDASSEDASTDADDVGAAAADDLEPEAGGAAIELRFTDPCAGPEPGSPTSPDCPDGTPATTLLGAGGPTAPPLAIDEPSMGVPALTDLRCPVGVDPDGTVRAVVHTNVPASLTLRLRVRGEVHAVTVETPPGERRAFERRLHAGEDVSAAPGSSVQNCVSIPSLPRSLEVESTPAGTAYRYHPAVSGTDDLGNAVEHPRGFLELRVLDPDGYLDEWSDELVAGDGDGDGDDVFEISGVHVTRMLGDVEPRCPLHDAEAEVLRGLLTSTVPGSFQLALVDRGAVTPIGEVTTDDDERRLHTELWAGGEAPATTGPAAVQTCFTIPDLGNPGHYYLDVSGTDDRGRTTSARLPFTITDAMAEGLPSSTPGRPEPVLSERDDGGVDVLVAFDQSRETVHAAGLARTGDQRSGRSCTTIEPDVLRAPWSDRFVDLTDPPDPRRGVVRARRPGDPDDAETGSRFDRWQRIRVFAGEGDVLDVCVWVTTQPDGDFDPTVEERRQIQVQAPRRLRVELGLRDVLVDPAIEADAYTATAVNWPGSPSASFPPAPVADAVGWDDDCSIWHESWNCRPERFTLFASGGEPIPEVTHLRITHDDHGHTTDVRVETPTRCLTTVRRHADERGCATSTDDRFLRLPLPDHQGVFCITDCHGSRFALLRIGTAAGPAGPPGENPDRAQRWHLENTGPFDRNHLDLPLTPRADLTVDTPTVTDPAPGERPQIELDLPFDRPVDVTVLPELVSDRSVETCALPRRQSSTATAERHRFRFADTCFGARYQFTVHARDPVGGGHLRIPPQVFSVTTPGFGVASIDVETTLTSEIPMDDRGTLLVGITVGGERLAPAFRSAGACRDPLDWRTGAASLPGPGHEPVALAEHARVELDIRWWTCDGRPRRLRWGSWVDLEGLLAGPRTVAVYDDDLLTSSVVTVTPHPDRSLPPASSGSP